MSKNPILSIAIKDISSSSLLQKVRQRLSERQDVYVSGEFPALMQHDSGPYYLMEHIDFYIAPSEPNYNDEFLTDFTADLFPDIEPESPYEHKFQKFEYEKYKKPYWSLHFGRLRFFEEIGLLQIITQASHYISYDDESLKRWGIDTSIKGNVREQTVKRGILIHTFPERDLADLIYKYFQFCHNPHRGNPILRMLNIDRFTEENLSRTIDNLSRRIDIYSYEYLHSGKLTRDLETLLAKYSST